MMIEIAELESPIGNITLIVRDEYLCALNFTDTWLRDQKKLERRFGALDFKKARDPAGVVSLIESYFAGALEALSAIKTDPGGTVFQQRVWSRLRELMPGETISYGELARSIGSPKSVRAVGAANGANPIGIVIPCHRIIGSDGGLVGYGGGIERKQWLIRHEQRSTEMKRA